MIFQTVDDVKNKFDRIFPQGVDVRHHFEQWRTTPPYSFNDNVLPPYEFPYALNTLAATSTFTKYWGVLTFPGTIVGMLDLPTTLTCASISNPNSAYFISQGLTSGYFVGDWVTAGAVTARGTYWYIGLINAVHYWIVPSGASLSANAIPTLYNWPGMYVWAKNFYGGWTTGESVGIAISKWDGSYRYGKVVSFSSSPGDTPGSSIGLYSSGPLSDLRRNGVSPCFSLSRDVITGVIQNDSVFGLSSVFVPLRNEPNQANVADNNICQFDGYLVTPKNTASNFSPSYTLNTI